MRSLLSLVAVLAQTQISAQTEPEVIVVDQFLQQGSHYDSVVDAVAAARPGSTIVVRAGAYGLRTPIVIDKPLRIVGIDTAWGTPPGILHPLEIRDLSAGEVVELHGVSMSPSCLGRCADGLRIHDCAGTVIIDDTAIGASPYPNRVVSIQRCAKVYLRQVLLDAGEDPILIENSTVVCEDSLLISGSWTFLGDPPPRTTVRLGRGADVTLIRSQIRGTGYWPGPQSALAMNGGIVRVDSMSGLASEPLVAVGVAPQGATASGTIWFDPGAYFQGAPDPNAPGGIFVPPGIRVVGSPVRVVEATPANPGGSYTASLRGAHAGTDLFAAIVASPVTASPFPNLHPSIGTGPDPDYGRAWMDPGSSTVIYFGAPTGQVTQPVGPLVPIWSTTLLQGVFFGADNVVRLTPPVAQFVLDPDR